MLLELTYWIAASFNTAAALTAPVPQPDRASVPACSEANIDLLANDSDNEGATPLGLINIEGARLGAAVLIGNSTIRYTARDQTGTDHLVYVVRNARGDVAPGILTVEVTAGNCS